MKTLRDGLKNLYIQSVRHCGETWAKENFKGFCENMEEGNMSKNKINKSYTPNIYAVINGKMYTPESVSMRHEYRQDLEYEFHVTVDPFHALDNPMLTINNVIFNPPATIVFWSDGSKTVVKRQGNEEFDPKKGLTMAFFKKMHGNRGRYFDQIKKWTMKYEEERPKIKPIDWSAIATALLKTGVDPLSIEGFDQLLRSDESKTAKDTPYIFHDVYFATHDEANKALMTLRKIIKEYGFATVADLYDLVGDPSSYKDSKYGWYDLKNVRIMRIGCDCVLALPEAVNVDQFESKGD